MGYSIDRRSTFVCKPIELTSVTSGLVCLLSTWSRSLQPKEKREGVYDDITSLTRQCLILCFIGSHNRHVLEPKDWANLIITLFSLPDVKNCFQDGGRPNARKHSWRFSFRWEVVGMEQEGEEGTAERWQVCLQISDWCAFPARTDSFC